MAPPPLSNETLHQRLLTGASTKGGSRGSLTRCAAKLGALHAKLSTPGGSTSTDLEIQQVKEELKREARLFQVEMRKWMIMIQSAEKELSNVKAQEQAIAARVQEKEREIQELRNEAASMARTKICWQEYETLAKLARQRPPRRVLQVKMVEADADLDKTRKQLYETAAESKVREKQFHLLIHCMLDLKRSLGETIEIPPPPTTEKLSEPATSSEFNTAATKEEGADDGEIEREQDVKAGANKEAKTAESKSTVQPMEMEDEDDLYGGL
jgi:chromosome segregation ATPase